MKKLLLLLLLAIFDQFHFVYGFEVIWNVPSKQCKQLNPQLHNITTNTNNNFYGEKIVLFYETFGLFPFCNTEKTENGEIKCIPINGGVPQNVNLSDHLAKVQTDIEAAIPDVNFDGYAVIDYEAWRPLYDINWSSRNIYRKYSQEIIQEKFNLTNRATVQYLARFEFDLAAKTFLLETINLAKKLRPNGKWGFWEYPLCDYEAGYSYDECLQYYKVINNQLSYLLESVDVLYPSIYFYGYEAKEKRIDHAYARLKQSFDYISQSNRPVEIVPYIKIEYSPSDNKYGFYSKQDLCASIKYPAEIGLNTVIIWSSSYKMKQRCEGLVEYMDHQLGPFVEEVLKRGEKCNAKHCSGNGRCYTKSLKPPEKCEIGYNHVDISCKCDLGFIGDHCETKIDLKEEIIEIL